MTPEDRELLEAAAKAAGMQRLSVHWNPLEDDGDALRLEITLKLSVLWDSAQSRWIVTRAGLPGYLAADPDRKRASVCAAAAAEIGRSMT